MILAIMAIALIGLAIYIVGLLGALIVFASAGIFYGLLFLAVELIVDDE